MSELLVKRREWTTRKKVLVGFLTMAAIGFVTIMPALAWQLHEANNSLRVFGNALIAKQYVAAYALTSEEFRASVDFSKFKQANEGLVARMGDLKDLRIAESEIRERTDGWHGTAEADLNFSRGILPFTFILKKENGSWKIHSYQEQ